jgi:hypothetical protein
MLLTLWVLSEYDNNFYLQEDYTKLTIHVFGDFSSVTKIVIM